MKEEKKITLSLELAKEMYNGENKQLKQLALDNFPQLGGIKEQIKNVQNAIDYLGCEDIEVEALRLMKTVLKENTPALVTQELVVVCKALNEGKRLTAEQKKFIPWYYFGDNTRFSDVICYVSLALTSLRLFLDSEDKVLHLVKHFNDKLIIHYNS